MFWVRGNPVVVQKLQLLELRSNIFNTASCRLYWTEEKTHRDALEKFGREHLGVKELKDWYNVKALDVYNNLRFIRTRYGSLHNALKALYPSFNWDSLSFSRLPNGFWNTDAQRMAIEKFGKQRGVKELNDWYSVSAKEASKELSFIGQHYKGSLFQALKTLYPQHKWDRLRFSRVPTGYWSDENTQRNALERLGREHLGVKELDDWYKVTGVDVHSELSFIYSRYNGSLPLALKHLYPQHEWDPLKFSRLPRKYWQQEATVQHYHQMFSEWKKMYDIRSVSDWYHQLVPQQVKLWKLAAKGIFGSTVKMLQHWFPETLLQNNPSFISQVELQVLSIYHQLNANF